MDPKSEILWRMYEEHCNQGRFHDSQRATLTSVIMTIAAITIGLVGLDKNVNTHDIPLGFFVIALGLFGALFSYKSYERFRLHMRRAQAYRNELDVNFDHILKKCKTDADNRHSKDFPHLSIWRLHWMWVTIQIFVILLGLVLVFMGICNNSPAQP